MTLNDALIISACVLLLAAPLIPPAKREFRRWQIARAIRQGQRDRDAIAAELIHEEAAEKVEVVSLDEFAGALGVSADRVVRAAMGSRSPAPQLGPGRQKITGWSRPFPADAKSAPWEDLHTFAGGKPKRDPYYGLMHSGMAISLICPSCSLEQAPLTSGKTQCGYCGNRLQLVGSHVFWWRPEIVPEVPEWRFQ